MTALLDPLRPTDANQRRRLIRSGAGLVAARLVGMAMSLLMIPIAVDTMSAETFGLWMTVASISSVVALFNLGIGSSLVSMIARNKGRSTELSKIVSTGFGIAGLGGLAAGLCFGSVLLAFDWSDDLGLDEVSEPELKLVLGLCLILFALTMPLGIIANIRQGQERHDIVAALTVLASALALGLVGVGAWTDSWQVIVICQFAGMFGAMLVGWALSRRSPKVPVPRRRDFDTEVAPTLVRTSSHYFGLQLAAVVAFSSDNLIAAKLFGASGVGEYAVAARVATTALALLALPATPLWSAIARSMGEGDEAWIDRIVRRLRRWLPVLALGTFASFAIIVGPVSGALSGGTYEPGWDLRLWLAAFVAVGTVGNWIAPILNGLSMTRVQLVHSATMATVNIVTSVLLARQFGVVGLAAGSALSYLFFLCIPYYRRLGSLTSDRLWNRVLS